MKFVKIWFADLNSLYYFEISTKIFPTSFITYPKTKLVQNNAKDVTINSKSVLG